MTLGLPKSLNHRLKTKLRRQYQRVLNDALFAELLLNHQGVDVYQIWRPGAPLKLILRCS
jgi:hypothetical protein